MKNEVRYISHGDLEDGGYRHEKYFAQSLAENKAVPCRELRKRRLFIGFANINIVVWGFWKAGAMYNVVAARLGLSAWFRNLCNGNLVYVVVHDYDKNRYNSKWLKLYYPLLFLALKVLKPKRIKLVVISEYWVKYFTNKKGISRNNLFLFPNLIAVNTVLKQRVPTKEKWIHLGQFSIKNGVEVYEIASLLSSNGYYCYFSTLDKSVIKKAPEYDVVYFGNYESYLSQMAKSQFTLGFSKFHEGWNRVVHESALLNTPVIAFKKGGMQYLVGESNNYLVDTVEQALALIYQGVEYQCPQDFVFKYDVSKAQNYF